MLSTLPPDIGPDRSRGASPGRMLQSAGRHNHVSRIPTDGPVGQKNRITASNGTDEATYVARFTGGGTAAGVVIDVTAVATASSATGVRDPLKAAILASALLMAYCATVVDVSTNAVDVTAREGATFTVTFPTNPSSHLSTAVTAATDAAQYTWGRAVEVVASPTLPSRMTGSGIRKPVAIDGAVFDLTQTHDGSGDYFIEFLVRDPSTGSVKNVPVTWTDGGSAGATDTTAKSTLEALDFIAEADIVSTGVITVTGMPGVELSIVDYSATGGSAALAIVIDTEADALPRFALVLDDRATAPLDTVPATIPTGPTPGNAVLTADSSGRSTTYAVPAPSSSLAGTAVWVETASGSEGVLLDAATATATPWPEARWASLDSNDAAIAYLEF